MALSPTIPNLYKYAFLTSRAADLLSKKGDAPATEQQREVLSACKELVNKIIQGERFLIGPRPEEVHNLRPEDIEIFTYVLDKDSIVRELAGSADDLFKYLHGIFSTFEALTSQPPKEISRTELDSTLGFLSRFADSLTETARDNLRRPRVEEPTPVVDE